MKGFLSTDLEDSAGALVVYGDRIGCLAALSRREPPEVNLER